MSVYRFPPITIEPKSFADQIDKIFEEVNEVWDAYINHAGWEAVGIELLDAVQALEKALMMLPFTEEQVEQLRAEVIRKNAVRGYYRVNK